jgi:hypothetical protein
MINKRKLLHDYLHNIEDSTTQDISIQVLGIYNDTKPKTEILRNIKKIIEKLSEYENQ